MIIITGISWKPNIKTQDTNTVTHLWCYFSHIGKVSLAFFWAHSELRSCFCIRVLNEMTESLDKIWKWYAPSQRTTSKPHQEAFTQVSTKLGSAGFCCFFFCRFTFVLPLLLLSLLSCQPLSGTSNVSTSACGAYVRSFSLKFRLSCTSVMHERIPDVLFMQLRKWDGWVCIDKNSLP